VKDLFRDSKLPVERDGGLVAVVGLYKDDPRVAAGSDLLEAANEGRSETAPTVLRSVAKKNILRT